MALWLSKDSFELLLYTVWGIWTDRNSLLWWGVVSSLGDIRFRVQSWQTEYKKWHGSELGYKMKEPQRWCKPDQAWLKINFDRAWDEHRQMGGCGVVVRDKVCGEAWGCPAATRRRCLNGGGKYSKGG
ncbi:ribonuclease H protein [Pyrus ussuriensis x Pyrus communis]|uniref:Ribonuclease H protein n=1 Tax=Pyrus ussuriensis x Pyrus communis TaxID=2448454 RepID=A0A5N5GQS5_9ROSA|nr:ribonuclease H protein [Pyrus ussuriensis x Pyrus communis]